MKKIQKNAEFSFRAVTGKSDFEKVEFLASDVKPKLMGEKINTTTEVYYYWLIVQKGIPIIIRVYENRENQEEGWKAYGFSECTKINFCQEKEIAG